MGDSEPTTIAEERRRILGLVADRTITAREGDRLLEELRSEETGHRCPYCAEVIPAGLPDCPACQSTFERPVPAVDGVSTFRVLPAGARGLVLYMIVVCSIVTLGSLPHLGQPAALTRLLLAAMGWAAVVGICRRQPAGWTWATWWATLQILEVYWHQAPLNRQFLGISFNVNTGGAMSLGVNLVGILLLVLIRRIDRGAPTRRVT